MTSSLFFVCDASYKHCLINPQESEVLKYAVQRLIDQGIIVVEHMSTSEDVATMEILYDQVQPLQIPYDLSPMTISDNLVVPLMIIMPTLFPLEDTKAILWIYDSTIYIHGQKVRQEPVASNEPMVSIIGIGGVTRSGRIFAHVPPVIDNGWTSNQEKGKQVEKDQQSQDFPPTIEVEKFLRITKKSDYKVVDQLNQTLSKISLLSFLMCSEAYRDALVKFLRAAVTP